MLRVLYGGSGLVGRAAPRDHRRNLDAILWMARTGAPWRDLPLEFGNWNSVHRQFRRWTASGLWDLLLQALADGSGNADLLQMIDSTIIRAHHCAAGARGGTMGQCLGRSCGGPLDKGPPSGQRPRPPNWGCADVR